MEPSGTNARSAAAPCAPRSARAATGACTSRTSTNRHGDRVVFTYESESSTRTASSASGRTKPTGRAPATSGA